MSALEIINELKKNNVIPSLHEGQLKLSGQTRQLPDDLLEKVKQSKFDIIDFLKGPSDSFYSSPIPGVVSADSYSASEAQKRLWALSQFEGGTEAYNIVTSLYLKGDVHVENLNKSFKTVIQRHEILRTTFTTQQVELRQVIAHEVDFDIIYEDKRDEVSQDFLLTEIESASRLTFDFSTGPFLMVKLFRLHEAEFAMVFCIHHIVSDGWSINILISEVLSHYKALCTGKEFAHEPLRIHYKDYAAWLDTLQKEDDGKVSRLFWQNELADLRELSMPYDYARPEIKNYEGRVSKFYFRTDLYNKVLAFCMQYHVTRFNFFRATISLLLHKYSGQRKIVIGSPVSGRTHYDLENQIGMYVNTLPLVSCINPEDAFLNFIRLVSENSYKAIQHQGYSLERIMEDQKIKRDPGRNPLFDIMMVLQDTSIGTRKAGTEEYPHAFELNYLDAYLYSSEESKEERRPAKCDLTFNFDSELGDKYFLEIEYSTQLFKKETIAKIFRTYCHILQQVLEEPQRPIHSIQTVTGTEQHKLLNEFNKPIESFHENGIWELLQKSFQKKSDTAIVCGERQITYHQLDEFVQKSVLYLKKSIPASRKTLVGIMMERNEWMIASILGMLRSGIGYVPIDINYPADRVNYIIADASLAYLIVDQKGKGLVPKEFSGQIILVEDIQKQVLEPFIETGNVRDNVAYIIYTSGSTGRPKGVQITQKNVIAFLKWSMEEFANTSFEILYAATSYCFDLSVFEFLYPLCVGKSTRILNSPLEIAEYVLRDKKVFINTVPSVVRNLLDIRASWSNVTAINMAGEVIPPFVIEGVARLNAEVRNLYGPSEDTTYSTVYRLTGRETSSVPIGKPISYTQLYILDADRNLCQEGVPGEIYLSGQGVAAGYLNQPNLTAERFIDNPFIAGTQMYKTGDIGKWKEDGNVEFLGRADDQVKIRGNRIELGEIQHALESHPNIKKAAVVVLQEKEEKNIVAYWVARTPVSQSSIIDHLERKLPSYMVPAHFMELHELPLNNNGKLDKSLLPKPQLVKETSSLKPRNETEQQLLEIWTDVLTNTAISIDDNFFDLGGHSLNATKLKYLVRSNLCKEISLNEIFANPTIEKQAALLARKKNTKRVVIPTASAQENYPVSFSQERFWVLTGFMEASLAYSMPAAFEVIGDLEVKRLQRAFQLVISAHEILRTSFNESQHGPVQRVMPESHVDFTVSEITLDQCLNKSELIRYLQEEWRVPFDLGKGSLLKATVIRTPDMQILSFNMHHMISDGWSMGVLYKQVIQAYQGLGTNSQYALPKNKFQYKDYAVWQHEHLSKGQLDNELSFWEGVFSDGVPMLELPTDYYRPDVKTYNGTILRHQYDEPVSDELIELSNRSGVSLFMTLMACVNVLMKKYSNSNTIVIGTPVAGREHAEFEQQIGLYVNILAIKTALNGELTFSELLEIQKEIVLKCLENQNIPFELVIERLNLPRDLSRSPLFDVMMVLQNATEIDGEKHIADDLIFRRMNVPTTTAKYDLNFSFEKSHKGLLLELEYNTDLFKASTIDQMVRHLTYLFKQVCEQPSIKIKDINLLSREESRILSSRADKTNVAYDKTATLVSLFQQSVSRHGDKIALKFGEKKIAYKELDSLSSQLSRVLIRTYHVKNEDLICLHFDRTEWMIIGILAVIKAGAAYVPIDPTYPESRIEYILGDTGSKLILCDPLPSGLIRSKYNDKTFVDIRSMECTEEGEVAPVRPGSLAYVIYTSGTTGNPKGVLIEHENVCRLLFNEQNPYDFGASDHWPLFHSYCFDVSVWEMYGALLNGGTLVIVPKETAQDSLKFYDFLHENNITILNQTPTAFRSLANNNKQRFTTKPLRTIRFVIFAGEALSPEILKEWNEAMPSCKLVNMYGITETTVHVSYKEISRAEILENKSLIGDPLPTLSCYVLDIDMQLAPIGVIGELFVGGAGLGRGYLNKPELTAQRFVKHPYLESERLYRSGDYARILLSGEVEYIGRKDEQVKIRGHRIEMAEVEAAIAKQEDVKDVVVISTINSLGDHDLIAYYIPEEQLDSEKLRMMLHKALPSYMVPSYLIALQVFPLNRNGKLDRAALPKPETIAGKKVNLEPPRGDMDKKIVEIWESVLDIHPIGITDNFFDLGGHSLKATRVIARLHEMFGVKVDLKDLFKDPTVRHLSDYVEAILWMKTQEETITEEQGEIIF